jgi:excinuclease ABC subunit A
MSRSRPLSAIRLHGVRQNNLKGFDLDLPLRRLIVITGPSGSGKSSLAFDTLFAEGQRRYVETFSPYARQFFDRMDKPRVDAIEGIPPAIAIEQRNTVRSTRSTVGTMTELCDYLKLLWPQLAILHCRRCGRVVRPDTAASIWDALPSGEELLVTFDLPLADKLSLAESLALVERQGYTRLWLNGAVRRIEEVAAVLAASRPAFLTVIQDRLQKQPHHRARFAESAEQAYHFGQGRLAVRSAADDSERVWRFSRHLHCAECDLDYREPTPALFSFNHPLGACPDCRGFGRTITIDYARAVPDPTRTLAEGVVKPWQSGMSAECQKDLLRFCRAQGIPMNVPFERLPADQRRWIIEGDPDYGKDDEHEWPRAWYGVKGYFRWLESKAYKMHVRVLLSRYRAYTTCLTCRGRRFQPDALDYRVTVAPDALNGRGANAEGHPVHLTLADFYQLNIQTALELVRTLEQGRPASLTQALALVLAEVKSRLGYLVEVGLGYLTLDRPTRSLSGGETERVNLTTCLGTRLVNTLYVLDEPSVGLHARDTERLVRILQRLRDLGNTVVVVEHEPAIMRSADQIVDLGPGQGEAGGHIVFQGTLAALQRCRTSLTGQYLGGRRTIPPSRGRSIDPKRGDWIGLRGVTRNNLRNFDVRIPLGRLVCVTGVSGSGKSTLVREVLHPLLESRLARPNESPVGDQDPDAEVGDTETQDGALETLGRLETWESIGQVVLVDQSAIGRTPRSNPAVYVGAFDAIRDLYAASAEARRRNLLAGAFSFNSRAGQCERCRGAGFEKIEMQFLSDVFIRCPECGGQRYRPHVLEVKLSAAAGGWHIARMLEATVDEAIGFLEQFPEPAAVRAVKALGWLREVGLGYLRLGQPINTLSGGESQRLKLVGALAAAVPGSLDGQRPTLYLLDEPTTGLHFEDVRVLLEALQRLVDAGHSAVVIEHNLELIQAADWIIDLGPEAGEGGGRIVAEGPLKAILSCPASHTGIALRKRL